MENILTNDLLTALDKAKEIGYSQPKLSFEMSKKIYTLCKRKKLKKEEASSLIIMAFACRTMSNLKDCIKYSYQALMIFENIQDRLGQAKALNLIGIVYFYYAMYGQALENLEKSLMFLENMEDSSYLLSCVLNNIGEVYREANDHQKALDAFNRGLDIAESLGYKTNTAAIYNNIGQIYITEKKYSKALSYFKNSYAMLIKEQHPILLAETESRIAEIYVVRQDITMAEEYLVHALGRLEAVHNKFYIIDVLICLGQIEMIKDNDNFMHYFEKAINYAEETNAKKKLLKIYTILYELYESKGNYANAFEYLKKSHYIELELETSIQSQRLEIIKFELEYLKANIKFDKISNLNHRLNEEIKSQQKKLQIMQVLNADLNKKALYDDLTEVPNRRYIVEHLKMAWERARNEDSSIAFYLIDIDNFKDYNDFWGHNKGDECLKSISNCLKKVKSSKQDFFGRYGGEEFIYFSEKLCLEEAMALGNILKNEIESLRIKYNSQSDSKNVTISIGGFYGKISNNIEIKDIIQVADKELYKAKDAGRNKFFMAK